jgi:hypothetical protein
MAGVTWEASPCRIRPILREGGATPPIWQINPGDIGMAKKGRTAILKRQREVKKAERAALKREKREIRKEEDTQTGAVATADDLAGYGFGPADDDEIAGGAGHDDR